MDASKRAKPPAKKPSENNGQGDCGESPEETGIDAVGAQQGSETDQRIQLQEPIDGPSSQLPPLLAQVRCRTKPEEEQQEKALRNASNRSDSHEFSLERALGGAQEITIHIDNYSICVT